jgi:hypothetical protein
MRLSAFDAVAQALHRAGVRYLVAGGLAVNAHGYLRFTADIDLILALDLANIRAAFDALTTLGYRPSVPIEVDQFADPAQRQRWATEKGMQVLSLFSDRHPETLVDPFVQEPVDFEVEYTRAMAGEVLPGVPVRFLALPTLIRMKEAAGRPRNHDDIQHLRWILEESGR